MTVNDRCEVPDLHFLPLLRRSSLTVDFFFCLPRRTFHLLVSLISAVSPSRPIKTAVMAPPSKYDDPQAISNFLKSVAKASAGPQPAKSTLNLETLVSFCFAQAHILIVT